MSLLELRKIEVENCEHEFKYQLGDVVYLKNDLELNFPMIVIDYIPDESRCSDYLVSWMNKHGNQETSSFPEECLVQNKPKN